MSFRVTTAIIAGLFCISLGGWVLARNPHGSTNRSFALYNLTLAIWAFDEVVVYIHDHQTALIIYRLCYVVGSLIVFSFVKFVFSIANYKISWPYKFIKWLTLPFAFFSATDLIIKNIEYNYSQSSPIVEIPGSLYNMFMLYFISTLAYSLYGLIRSYRDSQEIIKNQLRYVALAICLGIIAATIFLVNQSNNKIPPVHYLIEMAISSIFAFAIMRYRVMDLGLVFRWGLAYGGSLLVVISIFLTTVFLFEWILTRYLSIGKGIPTIISACLAVLLFDPVRKRINKFADKFIFKSPDFQILLDGIQTELNNSNSTDIITQNLATHFKNIWNVDHVGFSLWDSKLGYFRLYPSNSFNDKIITRLNETINQSDFLVRTLESERRLFPFGIVVDEELIGLMARASLGERTTFSKIRRSMRWIGASACVPIMANDTFLGFIILGPKKNRALYNNEDKKFLSHVSEFLSEKMKGLLTGNQPIDNSERQPAIG